MPSADKSARASGEPAVTERVAAPSPIDMGIHGSARLATQRQQIRELFGTAAWSPDDTAHDRGVSVARKEAPAPAPNGVAQRARLKRLRIGITGNTAPLGIYANALPYDTYVWIMTNQVGAANALDANVTVGPNASSPGEIIAANATNVGQPLWRDESRSGGEVNARIFQSGPFIVPRQSPPNGDRNKVDYSFLRYAALQSYGRWHGTTGAALGWPALGVNTTLLETIDSDVSGITGTRTESAHVETHANQQQTVKAGWLAEAGSYRWDWRELKDDDRIIARFTPVGQALDTAARDAALSAFSDAYTEAEIEARSAAARADILNIYFPEPATRLSGEAVTLLNHAQLSDMAVTRGSQIGHKRESVGMIAALVHLDKQTTRSESRSKAKLRFTPNFVVTTGLGLRKSAYVSLFLQWDALRNAIQGGPPQAVDISTLQAAKEFDQSYLNDGMAGQVFKWHIDTLSAMSESAKGAGPGFFHPS